LDILEMRCRTTMWRDFSNRAVRSDLEKTLY